METSNISLQVNISSPSEISSQNSRQTLAHDNEKKDKINEQPIMSDDVNSEEMSPANLEKVAQQLQNFISDMNRSLEFHVDEDSGRDVIKVIDKQSGDLVKQYPSEEVLQIVANLAKATGALVDFKV